MAYIDDLVALVDNPQLRGELRTAVKRLRSTRSFGLVYEEHVPEVLALPGLQLEVGGLAQRADSSLCRVTSVNSARGGGGER